MSWTSRERSRRRLRRQRIHSRSGASSSPGCYADHFGDFREYAKLHPAVKPVIVCRESTDDQVRNGNLDRDMDFLLVELKKIKIRFSGVFDGEETSYSTDPNERPILVRAARFAEKIGQPILWSSFTRPLRSRIPSENNPHAIPTETEFAEFHRLTRGMPLLLWLPPTVSPRQEKSFRVSLGPKGGRPMLKKNRRKKLKPIAIDMRERGASLGEIARELDVRRSTLQSWLAGVPKGVRF